MKKPLSPRTHGYIDYASVAILALSPTIFGFGGAAAAICYIFGAALLGISLLTAYPLGAAKVIPFTIHGGIEAVSAPVLLLSPWIFGFADVAAARNFFIVAAIALGILFLVTNYRAAERPHRAGVTRRTTV